jgi:hypothetical protein
MWTCSIIQGECKKLKIKVPKSGTVDNFLGSLKKLREERRKAENVFLDEVEQDISQKEKFLTE